MGCSSSGTIGLSCNNDTYLLPFAGGEVPLQAGSLISGTPISSFCPLWRLVLLDLRLCGPCHVHTKWPALLYIYYDGVLNMFIQFRSRNGKHLKYGHFSSRSPLLVPIMIQRVGTHRRFLTIQYSQSFTKFLSGNRTGIWMNSQIPSQRRASEKVTFEETPKFLHNRGHDFRYFVLIGHRTIPLIGLTNHS